MNVHTDDKYDFIYDKMTYKRLKKEYEDLYCEFFTEKEEDFQVAVSEAQKLFEQYRELTDEDFPLWEILVAIFTELAIALTQQQLSRPDDRGVEFIAQVLRWSLLRYRMTNKKMNFLELIKCSTTDEEDVIIRAIKKWRTKTQPFEDRLNFILIRD